MAALFLIAFGAIGIGKYIHKVPESIVLGFTAGIAIVLFFGQVNSFLGLHGIVNHDQFLGKVWETLVHLPSLSIATILVGLASLLIVIKGHRIPVIGVLPTTLIAVTVSTLAVLYVPIFHSVATLGSAYGSLPLGFPQFDSANISLGGFHKDMIIPALEIAGLITIESLLCAVVADKLTKTRHRPNQELVAQGFANLGSIFMGGIPATGVIARTGTNIKSGATSRLSASIHAIVVVLFIVALAPLAARIPLTTLSAVLIVTAYKISELKEVTLFVRNKKWQLGAVLLVTLGLTVVTDLVTGVGTGLLVHLAFEAHGKLMGARGKDGALVLDEEEMV
jgi:SulP family sulfate permease